MKKYMYEVPVAEEIQMEVQGLIMEGTAGGDSETPGGGFGEG